MTDRLCTSPQSGTTDNTCVAAVLEQLGTETRVCNCSAACNGTDYEIDLSTAVWPSKKYLVGGDCVIRWGKWLLCI